MSMMFLSIMIALSLLAVPGQVARADSLTVDNTTSGTIYDNGCGTILWQLLHFLVTSHFTVSDVKLGLEVEHGSWATLWQS